MKNVNSVLLLLFFVAFGCESEGKLNRKRVVRKKAEMASMVLEEKQSVSKVLNQLRDTIFYSNKYFSNLSDQFNFRLKIAEQLENVDCTKGELKLEVLSKNDSLLQTITCEAYSCAYHFTDIEVSHVRSLETHFNENRELADGYYHGEMLVGDFNFDSLTDIAIIRSYPMSGTPTYEFYFQNENFEFERDRYFSDVVENIPQKLNPEKKTFIAWSHTGCCWAKFRYFKFDETDNCKLIYEKETGPEQE